MTVRGWRSVTGRPVASGEPVASCGAFFTLAFTFYFNTFW
jgi:hypothetical protein